MKNKYEEQNLNRIWIGTSGWNYWHWKNRFYPINLSQSKWFDFYATYFNTVEVNMSFYRWPSLSLLKKWKEKAKKLEANEKLFRFTLKANRSITHLRKLKNISSILKRFYELAKILEPFLGCILFQLPPSLKFDEKLIENFLSNLDYSFFNVIEFRHKSWWNKKTYDLLKDKAAFCIVSAPRLPNDFIKTIDFIYIRFHGKENWYRDNYSDKELEEWAEKIKKSKAKIIYCYFNNDFNAYAVFNALKLKRKLEFIK